MNKKNERKDDFMISEGLGKRKVGFRLKYKAYLLMCISLLGEIQNGIKPGWAFLLCQVDDG
jgi:hypothetical protein